MVDTSRYLYWLKDNSDNMTKEVVFREMYSRIGHFFHVIQMVEYNIANIISIEEFEKENKTTFEPSDIERIRLNIEIKYQKLTSLTFGKLVKELSTSIYLKSIKLENLEEIVKFRNYLAHNCFKEKLLENKLDRLEDVDAFVDELNDYEEKAVELNDHLVQIFENNKIKSILIKK